jgi:ABC-type amino acid transport substrate-binding protein
LQGGGEFFIKGIEAAGIRVYETLTLENAVKMLQVGQVDFVVDGQIAGKYKLISEL